MHGVSEITHTFKHCTLKDVRARELLVIFGMALEEVNGNVNLVVIGDFLMIQVARLGDEQSIVSLVAFLGETFRLYIKKLLHGHMALTRDSHQAIGNRQSAVILWRVMASSEHSRQNRQTEPDMKQFFNHPSAKIQFFSNAIDFYHFFIGFCIQLQVVSKL